MKITLDKRQLRSFYRRIDKASRDANFLKEIIKHLRLEMKSMNSIQIEEYKDVVNAKLVALRNKRPNKPNVKLSQNPQERIKRELNRLLKKGTSLAEISFLLRQRPNF